MNIRGAAEYIRTNNPNKKPYYDAEDERLKVILILCDNSMQLIDYSTRFSQHCHIVETML